MNEIEEVVKEKVEEVKSVTPVYVWKTGKAMFLSKKEKVVADTFLNTRSYMECERALKREGVNRSWQSCRRWLSRGNVEKYIEEQLEERGLYAGWSKEHWYKVMSDHLSGKKRLADGDGYFMNLLAKYKGWGVEGMSMNNNVQINFTER